MKIFEVIEKDELFEVSKKIYHLSMRINELKRIIGAQSNNFRESAYRCIVTDSREEYIIELNSAYKFLILAIEDSSFELIKEIVSMLDYLDPF
jgi:hypothetical protein